VRVAIGNDEGKLRPGMFVYARIEPDAAQHAEPAVLAVPASAVTRVGAGDVIFVRTGARSFEMRQVRLIPASDNWLEIAAGVSEGESIAVTGAFVLKSEALKGTLEEHQH
jgi:multidrug efflux pump subunit AcrA (membrane-fusion protein)